MWSFHELADILSAGDSWAIQADRLRKSCQLDHGDQQDRITTEFGPTASVAIR
jgi:hypothetical protein